MRACAGSTGSGRIQGFIPALLGAQLGWTLLLPTRQVPAPVPVMGTVMFNVIWGFVLKTSILGKLKGQERKSPSSGV